MGEIYHSKVYTDRPAYADFDAPAKFTAIQSIIAKRLKQYPKAICSYSGGADSDIEYKAKRMAEDKAKKKAEWEKAKKDPDQTTLDIE